MLVIRAFTEQLRRQLMKSIIEQFYYGEVRPCEMPAPNTKKYKETQQKLAGIEDELRNKAYGLGRLIDEFKDIQHLLAAMESLNDFARGFRFGAKFILDALGKDENK